MGTHCQTCNRPISNHKNRYCRKCGRAVLAELQRVGYLQNTYVPPYFSEERGRKGMRDMRAVGGSPY